MRPDTSAIVLGMVAITLAGACSGGGEIGRVKAASRTLTKTSVTVPSKRSATLKQWATVPIGYQIFIDGSQSMGGFAGCLSSPTEFDNALDHLSVDLGVTSVVRFGGDGRSATFERLPIDRKVHCPDFFSHAQNPDADLFARILADSLNMVSLYVTDGVQSDLAANQSPSVKVLDQWVEAGYPLAILAMKSRFDGRAWSEARKAWVGRWKTPSRPFYVYVFARSDAQLDAVLARFNPALKSKSRVLRFGDSMIRCTLEGDAIPKQSFDRDPLWMMLALSSTKKLEDKALGVAQQNCSVSNDSPLRAIQFAVSATSYGRWNSKGFTFPLSVPAGTRFAADSNALSPDGFRAILRVRIADDPTTRFGFYAVTLKPAAVDLKRDVAELSTDNDAELTSADKTYRFAWVVEQLMRAQVERTVASASLAMTVNFR